MRRGAGHASPVWRECAREKPGGVSGARARGEKSPGRSDAPSPLPAPAAPRVHRVAPPSRSCRPSCPCGTPQLQGPGTRPRGRPPKPRVGGTGRGCEGERPRSLPHGAGRRAGHRCHLLCGFASLDETARVDGLSKPEGCEGRAGGPLVPQPPCRFSSQRVHSVSLFQASLCRQKKITNTPICTFPLSRVRDVRQLRSRRSPLVPPTRAGCPSPSARSGRPRPFPV